MEIKQVPFLFSPTPSSPSEKAPIFIASDQPPIIHTYAEGPEQKAVREYLGGKVPERGSNVVDLVKKMVF